MNFYNFISQKDKYISKNDKILCQYLLFDKLETNLSLCSMFNKLKKKYGEEKSFYTLIYCLNLLDYNIHVFDICPTKLKEKIAFEIDFNKIFMLKLYKECTDDEVIDLEKTVFKLPYDNISQHFFEKLSDCSSEIFERFNTDLLRFATARNLPNITNLVECYLRENANNSLAIAPAINSKNYDIYEDRNNFCIVFNAYDVEGFEAREGSDKDVHRIFKTFESIRGFEVHVETLESKDIVMGVVSKYVQKCQTSDMMICFFMSHGDYDHILTENGDKLDILSILDLFLVENAPLLAGKPKLLIFQACRGNERNKLIDIHGNEYQTDSAPGRSILKPSPNLSDYFMAFPSSSGYVANRNPLTGSVLINAFCDVVEEHYKKLDLFDIFLEINERGKNTNIGGTTQIAENQNNLSKHVYFDFPET